MMTFDNKEMRQPCEDKPHIALIDGHWRVSPRPNKRYNRRAYEAEVLHRWLAAHKWVLKTAIEQNIVTKTVTFGHN